MANERKRFWSKVQSGGPDECWLWTGYLSNGYGVFRIGGRDGRRICAHRFAYMDMKGEIPDGLVIDHLCRNRQCVNPSHLEAVTHHENLHRGIGPTATNAAKTHCKRGHPLAGDNVMRTAKGRQCRECFRMLQRRYSQEKRSRLLQAGMSSRGRPIHG